MRMLLSIAALLGAAACTGAPTNTSTESGGRVENATTDAPLAATGNGAGGIALANPSTDRDAWLGRWIGVEGLNLTVTKGAGPGRYSLKMQYGTDEAMSGTFEGVSTADGIAFTRPDGDQVLRASTGEETGLKYLAGKKDCLKVRDGEGYCRK